MFRKTIPSLSTQVWLELIVEERRLGLFSWVEVSEETYNEYAPLEAANLPDLPQNIASSLVLREELQPHQMPADAQGTYYKSFPCVRLFGPVVAGEELSPSLAGRFFKAQGYSMLDLDDPSIGSWELEDGAVFTIGVDYDGYPRPCFNAISYEQSTKMHPMRAARQMGAPVSLMVYMPFKGMNLTDCSMTLKFNKALGYASNVTFQDTEEWNYLPHLEQAMPSIRVVSGGGSIAADAMQEVEVELVGSDGQVLNRNTTLYIETTGGYIPKNRVSVSQGRGTFKVRALDLEVGDVFKVKVGFRTLTGMLDVNFQVS